MDVMCQSISLAYVCSFCVYIYPFLNIKAMERVKKVITKCTFFLVLPKGLCHQFPVVFAAFE